MSFLFPKQRLRKPIREADGALVYFGGAFRTYAVKSTPESFTSRQIFTTSNPYTGAGRASVATPPYHWHLYQTETFEVNKGVLCYVLDGKEGKLKEGESVVITPHRLHTFWSDPESGVDLDVNITVQGGPGSNSGFDERFIRNFYGYLSSVTMQGLSPNPLQMLAFMDSADVVLVFPLNLGRLLNVVLGRWVGNWIAGYQTDYKEFADD